jgi:hypothetical protein
MGATGAGSEQWDSTNNRCLTSIGVVPWGTLNVPEMDAWGRRFSYRVTNSLSDAISKATYNFTQTVTPANAALNSPANQSTTNDCSSPTPTPTLSSFALCSLGDIAVYTRNDTTHAKSPIGTGIPAVIISHGKNGYGAYQGNGTRVIGSGDGDGDGVPDQNADEAANVNGTTQDSPGSGYNYLSYVYFGRSQTSSTSGCSDTTAGSPFCEFDDIVLTISPSTLITRMISAGKLP